MSAASEILPMTAPEVPMLRVVRGQADDEEIAALLTALAVTVARPGPTPARRAPLSAWVRPAMSGFEAGIDGWRRSGLPGPRMW